MANYDSTRTGTAHDGDESRISTLEGQNLNARITALENTIQTQQTLISSLQNQIISLQSNEIATLNKHSINTQEWNAFTDASGKIGGFYAQKIIKIGHIVYFNAQFKVVTAFNNGDVMFRTPAPAPIATSRYMGANFSGTFSYIINTNGDFVAEVAPTNIKAGDWGFAWGLYICNV